jgi:glycosyltransferase involved in cell wall biosynthesis
MTAIPGPPVSQHATIVVPTTAEFDSRTHRLAGALAARGHRVTVLARSGPGLGPSEDRKAGYEVVRRPANAVDGLPLPARFRRGLQRLARVSSLDRARRIGRVLSGPARIVRVWLETRAQVRAFAGAPAGDLVHAMAFLGLPVGLAIGVGNGIRIPVIYDARDIYAEARNIARLPAPIRRTFAWNERRWARRAASVVTVNALYASVLEKRFGPPTPLVVMNCPVRRELPPTGPRRIHDRLGLRPEQRVVLYHGGFSRDRGIEQLIKTLPLLDDDVVLVLLGYGHRAAELEEIARAPGHSGRLFVLPAVPPTELLDWVGSADVAAMPIQPSTLNHRLTTPNKLFEAMAAGVPVVASDLPGMAGIVRETGCGVLCDPTSAAAIAAAIRSILEAPLDERVAYRERALAAAHGPYSWEAQMELLLAEYGRLTGRAW